MTPPNVIIFGTTGAGKSSIVNLLAGDEVAKTSSSPYGCTFENNAYSVSIDGMMFNLHDTVGLEEGGRQVTVDKQRAFVQLYQLLHSLSDGVSLLIFCLRGPKFDWTSCVRNWMLFWDIICQRHVPVLLAITGLENEEDMDAWWEMHHETFTINLMYPTSVACITATKGKKRRDGSHVFDIEYAESQEKMKKAIQSIYRREPWKAEKREWFSTTVETVTIKSGKGSVKEVKVYKKVLGSFANELIQWSLMRREDIEALARKLTDPSVEKVEDSGGDETSAENCP